MCDYLRVMARCCQGVLFVQLVHWCLLAQVDNFATAVTQTQETNYYRILGVPPNAKTPQIKKAYHKMSLKYHPDKNKEEGAEEMFMKIAEAYEVLSDEERRRNYDNSGSGDKPKTGEPEGSEPKKNPTSSEPIKMHLHFSGGDFHFHYKPEPVPKPTKAPDIMVVVDVDLYDLYRGSEFNVTFTRQEICHHCNGSGAEHKHDVLKCPFCHGSGERTTLACHNREPLGSFWQQLRTTCDRCGGGGIVVNRTCSQCAGQRVAYKSVNKTVVVPAGAPDTWSTTLPGEGDQFPSMQPGSLIVSLRVARHPNITRKEQDLFVTANITLFEALLGFQVNITHVDNRTIEVKHKEVAQPGFSIRLENEGMPILNGGGAHGDMTVMFDVEFPKKLEEDERQLLRTVLDQEAIDRIERVIRDRAIKENLEALNRPVGHELRARAGYETFQFVNVIDETLRIPYNGVLLEWSIVASFPGAVTLQVWRPAPDGFSSDGGGENWYTLMGETTVEAERAGPVRRVLERTEAIICEAGDVIGWRIDGGEAVLSYDPFDQGRVRFTRSPLPRGELGRTEHFPYPVGRTYPVQARIMSSVVAYEDRGCSGESLDFIDADSDLCKMRYVPGEAVKDRVRSLAVAGGLHVQLFAQCGGSGPIIKEFDRRAEPSPACIDLPIATPVAHLRILRS